MIPALALLLVFLPPSWGNDLFALPKAAVACLAIAVTFWRRPPEYAPANVQPWVYLAVALGISTLFSWDLGYSLVGLEHSRGLGLFQWAVCALLFVYGHNDLGDDVKRAVLWGGSIMAGYALFQHGGLSLPFLAQSFTGNRVGSTQGSPVLLGEMLVVCLPLAGYSSWPVAILFVCGACAAKSRSALIAIAVAETYLFYKEMRRCWG